MGEYFKQRRDEKSELCREYFELLIGPLSFVARSCGYALGVHGSLARDIDLIAAPWRESAVSPEHLIECLRKVVKAITGGAEFTGGRDKPEEKPCGRLGYAFFVTADPTGPYIDISVMPMITPEKRSHGRRR